MITIPLRALRLNKLDFHHLHRLHHRRHYLLRLLRSSTTCSRKEAKSNGFIRCLSHLRLRLRRRRRHRRSHHHHRHHHRDHPSTRTDQCLLRRLQHLRQSHRHPHHDRLSTRADRLLRRRLRHLRQHHHLCRSRIIDQRLCRRSQLLHRLLHQSVRVGHQRRPPAADRHCRRGPSTTSRRT